MSNTVPMRLWISLALFLSLSGCATYGERQLNYQNQLTQADFAAAEGMLPTLVEPQGSERILYWLELGSLQHLQGQYEASNRSLQRADTLTQAWLQLNNEERLKQFFSTQDSAVFQPSQSDRWLLHYLQIKNHYLLAQQGGGLSALDGMRVEARKLAMLLDVQRNRPPSASIFNDLLNGAQPAIDTSIAAYYWWWVGVAYERLGEWDNARIGFQRAASQANTSLAQQAKADRLRMEKLLGDDWQEALAELPEPLQQQVRAWQPTSAQSLQVSYEQWRPPVREIGLTIARLGDELVVSARGQTGSLLLASLYGSATISLPASDAFDVSVINFSLPYVPPVSMPASHAIVFSPAHAAHLNYQAQLPRLLINTAARELSKAAAVTVVERSVDSELALLPVLLSLYNTAVSGADTRYWMTVPKYIFVERRINDLDVQLPAGQVRLYLTSTNNGKE